MMHIESPKHDAVEKPPSDSETALFMSLVQRTRPETSLQGTVIPSFNGVTLAFAVRMLDLNSCISGLKSLSSASPSGGLSN